MGLRLAEHFHDVLFRHADKGVLDLGVTGDQQGLAQFVSKRLGASRLSRARRPEEQKREGTAIRDELSQTPFPVQCLATTSLGQDQAENPLNFRRQDELVHAHSGLAYFEFTGTLSAGRRFQARERNGLLGQFKFALLKHLEIVPQ